MAAHGLGQSALNVSFDCLGEVTDDPVWDLIARITPAGRVGALIPAAKGENHTREGGKRANQRPGVAVVGIEADSSRRPEPSDEVGIGVGFTQAHLIALRQSLHQYIRRVLYDEVSLRVGDPAVRIRRRSRVAWLVLFHCFMLQQNTELGKHIITHAERSGSLHCPTGTTK